MDPHISGWNPTAAQQQRSGLLRLLPVIGAWKAAGVLSAVGLGVGALFQMVMPHGHRPTDFIGASYGSVVASEQDEARPAIVQTTQQTARVQVQEQTKGQEQILGMTTAQQYGLMTAMPAIIGSWGAQVMCLYGTMSNDAKYTPACQTAQTLNNGINRQAGAVMDNFGVTRTWDGPPGANTVTPVMDAAPLAQEEFNRIARLESMMSPDALARAHAGLDHGTNSDMRMYLGRLSSMASENLDESGTPHEPRIIKSAPPQDRWPLPEGMRSKQNSKS